MKIILYMKNLGFLKQKIRALLCLLCVAYVIFAYYLTSSPFLIILMFVMIIGTIDAKTNTREIKPLIVLLLILLLIIPLVPTNIESVNNRDRPIDNIALVEPNILSADGDESSESITSFAETLDSDIPLDPDSDTNGDFSVSEWGTGESIADDILHYPDSFTGGKSLSDSGVGLQAVTGGSHVSTHADDDSWFSVWDSSSDGEASITLNFTSKVDIHEFTYYAECKNTANDDDADFLIYNWTANDWVFISDIVYGGSPNQTGTVNDPDFWSGRQVSIKMNSTDADSNSVMHCDYAWIQGFDMTLADSNHFAESFVAVDDWGFHWQSGLGGGDYGITTDGDVGDLWITLDDAGSEVVLYKYTFDTPLSKDQYCELNWKVEDGTKTKFTVRLQDSDGTQFTMVNDGTTSSAFTVVKKWLGATANFDDVKYVYWYLSDTTVGVDAGTWSGYMDYLRIFPKGESGWQHDGSTTTGTFNDAETNVTYTTTTDGDILTFNVTAGVLSGTVNVQYGIEFDGTTTSAGFERDYYPFAEASITSVSYVGCTIVMEWAGDGVYDHWYDSAYLTSAGIYRTNMQVPLHSWSHTYDWPLWFYSDMTTGDSIEIKIDYTKIYSMINWTFSDSAGDIAGMDTEAECVAYFDETEDALVMETDFSTGNDFFRLQTENTSIGYDTTDMVLLITLKADANTSCRFRLYLEGGSSDTDAYYFLYDDYQTLAIPLSATAHTVSYFWIYVWDWNTAEAGDHSISIKNNITIRPSWHDATEESGTFADSFADVSDWSKNDCEAGDVISSDGDIASIECSQTGEDTDRFYSNEPDFSNFEGYLELRYRVNTTELYYISIDSFTLDDISGDYNSDSQTLSFLVDTWTTQKWYLATDTIGSLRINIRTGSAVGNSGPVKLEIDYIRIAPADEMGYQIDASSIGEFVQTSTGDTPFIVEKGGVLSFENGDGLSYFDFDFTDIDTNYYPFLVAKVDALDGGQWWKIYIWDGDGTQTAVIDSQYTTGIFRVNLQQILADNTADYLRVYYHTGFDLDYIKFYSIANFTVTQGSCDSDEFLYVDNGVLTIGTTGETDYSYYFLLNYDPVLSVTTATYNVWNFTVSPNNDYSNVQFNIGGWQGWEGWGETRGSLTSGTLTDLQIQIAESTDGATISALKFIEDGTAPIIVRSFANPPDPLNDENIILSTVATDALDVYSVIFDAIVSPAGFSDVDYDATEQSDNLWSYSFTTLTTGHYTFKVIASDGANENELTEYAYIDFDVRAAEEIVLEIEIWSFDLLDYHVNINWKTNLGNTTLYAYDNDTLEATGTSEDATLQFAKSTVIGVHILDFLIDAGTSSIWKNNTQYQIAQEQIILSNSHYSEDGNSWQYSAEVNQNINYYIYDNDTLVESGSKVEGFFTLSRDAVNTIGTHIVQIKFNTSLYTEYAGGSYDVDSTLVFDSIDPDQDNETCVVGFRVVRSATSSLNYTVYETVSGETLIASGSISVTEGNFVSIGFEKSVANIEANATLIFTDGVSTVNMTVIYVIVQPKTITNNDGGYVDDSETTIIENQTNVEEQNVYEQPSGIYITQETAGILAVGSVIIFSLVYLFMRETRLKAFLDGFNKGVN